jgi:Ino eighty subunit 2
VQTKKHLTAEEHAMRRAEMARRRKNLSEKRNEEEKMETINKLLKKQAPKTNSRRAANGAKDADASPDTELQKPNPAFVRWVSNMEGDRIGVPEEWLEASVGTPFGPPTGVRNGGLIDEVQ